MKIKLFTFSVAATSVGALDLKKQRDNFSEDADSYPFSSWIKYISEQFMKAVQLESDFKCDNHLI